jgi:predicted nucleic acid-binding protein
VNSFYWDASALAKRYAPEIGTPLVNHLFTYVTPDRMLCLIVGVSEVISIFVRKKNARLITPEAFSQALVDFRTEIIEVDAFKLISIEDTLVFASHPLIEKHALNATDALILRSTLNMATVLRPVGNDIVLMTSDHRLLRAAQVEGLQTFNPEIDVQTALDILIQAQ